MIEKINIILCFVNILVWIEIFENFDLVMECLILKSFVEMEWVYIGL